MEQSTGCNVSASHANHCVTRWTLPNEELGTFVNDEEAMDESLNVS